MAPTTGPKSPPDTEGVTGGTSADAGGPKRPTSSNCNSNSDASKKPPAPPDSDQGSSVGANIDLVCNIASYMDTGGGLFEFCVAIGPASASRARHDYLLKNEQYLVKLLRKIRDCVLTPNPDSWQRDNKDLGGVLDGCGSNIKIWMENNTGWRSRCTAEKLEKYKNWMAFHHLQKDLDISLFFNNPAVAIELGLLDVLRHMVEKMNINLTKNLWAGFSMGLVTGPPTLVQRSLERNKASLLSYILSSESFGWRDDTHLGDLLLDANIFDCFGAKCFQILVAHPKVDVNVGLDDRLLPLCVAVQRLVTCLKSRDGEVKRLRLKKLHALLDAGANPRAESRVGAGAPLTAIDIAKKAVNDYPGESDMWRNILQKMEAYEEGV